MKKIHYLLLLGAFFLQGCLSLNYDNPVCISLGIQKPQLYSPADSSVNQSITPLFIWNSVEYATGYRLQLSTNESFSSYVIDESEIKDTLKQAGGIMNDTLYYWRVSASNEQETSEWSDIWNFRTVGTAPEVPTLVLPTNGATGQATTLSLSWNASSGATSYNIQVATDNSFTSFVYNQSGLTSTSQQVSGLSNLTTYYWRVSATNTQGTSNWSIVWSFTTIGTVPIVPTLISPTNGAINQSVSPTLSWSASSGATSYNLQVATDSSFAVSSLIISENTGNNTTKQISGLSKNTTYYWKVAGVNSIGNSGWSSVWSFTTFLCGISAVSYSGKIYNTVQIGTQCWLKENLDIGTRVDGNQNQDDNNVIEKYCYDNLPSNCITNGGLYQWNEAMQYTTAPGTQGICPSGWHIPALSEFETLSAAVSGNSNALKAEGQGTGIGEGTNTSGFSALLSGFRSYDGTFNNLGIYSDFWTSSWYTTYSSYYQYLSGNDTGMYFGHYNMMHGFSVRCIKDN